MTKAHLENIATQFRQAIITAKENRAFANNDRMSQFPRGCCDDTADLFAHYLYHKYKIVSVRIDGSHHDGTPENNCSHSWQEVDGLVVDLTGGQFNCNPTFLSYDVDVYVGQMDEFHRMFEIERSFPSIGIESLGEGCWYRMYSLYEIIIRYLVE